MFSVLSEPWAIRALSASLMVGLMCGLLGVFVVLRNMSLIGDALSHAVLPGVVVGFMVAGATVAAMPSIFIGAVLAGLLTAVIITWIQDHVKTKPDAAIGIVFTTMFALGVMGISQISKEQGVHLDLKDFLFGNVLGVRTADLWLTLGVTLTVLFSVSFFYRLLFASTFQPIVAQTMGISVKKIHYFLMLLLSFAVVSALQTVGVILVVAMLVTPAATALLLSHRLKSVLILSCLLGMLAALLGFVIAVAIETTPGPAMAVTSTLFYVIAVILAPKKGLWAKFQYRYAQKKKVQLEDILKQTLKLEEQGCLTFEELKTKTHLSSLSMKRKLRDLQKSGMITFEGSEPKLTATGRAAANRLVRAHRLWETYLVEKVGLAEDQIHDEAEKFEHLLTDELLDEVDEHLGFPDTDPHGSPIPRG